ncbi:hypothetical protein QBC38DRAFT_453143 [Podospora fimiseda]|uniref:Uncharacterized protein n=1 Tax=Podospora fimiseda TaxID=252190 RepID=A0AAN7BU52_9PEZI|nr:hypothetical protein QBC38DRAFT_453143 [Podospora fimiseda]
MHLLSTSRFAAVAAFIAICQMVMMICAWACVPRANAGCFAAAFTVLYPPLFFLYLALALPSLGRFCDLAKQIDDDWAGSILRWVFPSLSSLVAPVVVDTVRMSVGDSTLAGINRLLAIVMFRVRSSPMWAVMMHRLLMWAEFYADHVCKGTAERRESLDRLLESAKKQLCDQYAKIDKLNDDCENISRKAVECRGACRHDLYSLYEFFAGLVSFKVVESVRPEEGPIVHSFITVVERLAHQADMSMWWTMTGLSRLQAAISLNESLIDNLSQVLGQKDINYRVVAEHVKTWNCAKDTWEAVLSRAPPMEPEAPAVSRVKRPGLREHASIAERMIFRRTIRRKVWSQLVLPVTETDSLTPLTPVLDVVASLTGPEPPVPEVIERPVQDIDHAPTPPALHSPVPTVLDAALFEGFDHAVYLAELEAKRNVAAAAQEDATQAALNAAHERLHWSQTVLRPQQREFRQCRKRLMKRLNETVRRVKERGQEEEKQQLLLEDAPRTEEDRRPLDIQEQLRRAEERTANLIEEVDARKSKVTDLREALRAAEAEYNTAKENVELAQAEADSLQRQLSQPATDKGPETTDSSESEVVMPAVIEAEAQRDAETPLPQNEGDDPKDNESSLSEEEFSEGAVLGGSREPETEGSLKLAADIHDVDLDCQPVQQQEQQLLQPVSESSTAAATTVPEEVNQEGVRADVDEEASAESSMISTPEMEAQLDAVISDRFPFLDGPKPIEVWDAYCADGISDAEFQVEMPKAERRQHLRSIIREAHGDFDRMTEVQRDALLAEMESHACGVGVQVVESATVATSMLDAPELKTQDEDVVDGADLSDLPDAPVPIDQVAWLDQQRRVGGDEELVRGDSEGLFQGSELGMRSKYQPETISQPVWEPVVVPPPIDDTIMEESILINTDFQVVTGNTQWDEPYFTQGEFNEEAHQVSTSGVIQEVFQVADGACCPEAPEQHPTVSATRTIVQEPKAYAEGVDEVLWSSDDEAVPSAPTRDPEANADGEEVTPSSLPVEETAGEVAHEARSPAPVQQAASAIPLATISNRVILWPRSRKTGLARVRPETELREIKESQLQAATGGLQTSSIASESAEGSSGLNEHHAEGDVGEPGMEVKDDGEGKGQEPEANAAGESEESSEDESEDDEDMPDDHPSFNGDDSDGATPPSSNADGHEPEPYDPTHDYHHPSDDEPENPDLEDEFGSHCNARRAQMAARVQALELQHQAMEDECLRQEEETARKQRAQEDAARRLNTATSTAQQPKKRGHNDVSDESDSDIEDHAAMVAEDEDVPAVRHIRVADKRAIAEQKTEEKKAVHLFVDDIPLKIIHAAIPPEGTIFPKDNFKPMYRPESFSTLPTTRSSFGAIAQRYETASVDPIRATLHSPAATTDRDIEAQPADASTQRTSMGPVQESDPEQQALYRGGAEAARS